MNLEFFIAHLPQLAPYLLLLVVYFFISLQSELMQDRTFAVPVLIILSLFVGLCGVMTPDMQRYRWMYEDSSLRVSIEPTFSLLSNLLHAVGFDYHALFFSYALITLVCIYLGIRNYTPHVKLSLLLYILIPGYFLNLFVEMREMCAVAIAFYATSVLIRKQGKKRVAIFLVLAVLSALVHYSAVFYWIVVLGSYKFIRKPHSNAVYLSLLLVSLVVPTSVLMGALAHIALPILPARYHGYFNMFLQLETGLAEPGQLLKTVVYVTIGVFFVFWRPREQRRIENDASLNLFVLGVVILNLTRSFADASRFSYFFVIYQIILFPEVLERIRDRVGRVLAAYSVVTLFLAQFLWGLFFYSTETGTYPYLHYQNAVLSLFK